MMNNIIEKYNECVEKQKSKKQGFTLFQYTELMYIGVDAEGIPTVLCISTKPFKSALSQKTRKLSIECNVQVQYELDGVEQKKTVHIVRCFCNSIKERDVFLELCPLFEAASVQENQEEALLETMSILTSFFADNNEPSDTELQGLYAELYTIWSYRSVINLGKYWQSRQKMTFDFSLTDKFKIEIKSTTMNERKHHFRHEQLCDDPYTVFIISYLLRRDDEGLSLYDLIHHTKPYLAHDPRKLLAISRFVKNTSEERLKDCKFNEDFLEQRRRIYKATDIPRFKELTPDGVSSAEYDCNLDLAPFVEEKAFWSAVKESIDVEAEDDIG